MVQWQRGMSSVPVGSTQSSSLLKRVHFILQPLSTVCFLISKMEQQPGGAGVPVVSSSQLQSASSPSIQWQPLIRSHISGHISQLQRSLDIGESPLQHPCTSHSLKSVVSIHSQFLLRLHLSIWSAASQTGATDAFNGLQQPTEYEGAEVGVPVVHKSGHSTSGSVSVQKHLSRPILSLGRVQSSSL